jgi:quercetin dioxygenase-like cupin family protein
MIDNVKRLLNGNIIVRILPIVSGDVQAGLRRILLTNGELAEIYNSEKPIHNIAVFELQKGKIRGGHIHPLREENIYIIRGKVNFIAEEISSRERVTYEIEEGSIITISPNIAHALIPISDGYALEFSSRVFNNMETIKYQLFQ